MSQSNTPQQPCLLPLPYHISLRDYLRSQERDLWNWFSSAQEQADYRDNLRQELLKATYRLDLDGHSSLYEIVDDVKESLQLNIPVTLYQSQNTLESNAALFFVEGEGHIVFSGSALSLLSADETKSVIAHELAHYYFWTIENGDFQIVDRMMQASALDPRSTTSHNQSARLYRLYTEIFADRGSFHAASDINPVIGGLIKMNTGLRDVSPAGYLKQADEVLANGGVWSEGLSHPETYMRAKALDLWREHGDEAIGEISRLIEGDRSLDDLDIIAQLRLMDTTRQLLKKLLRPKWFRTEAVMAHARRFFEDFRSAAVGEQISIDGFRTQDPKLVEYVCYVLLDFVTADPDLEDLPMAAAMHLAAELEISSSFDQIAASELKITPRAMKRLRSAAETVLAREGDQHV